MNHGLDTRDLEDLIASIDDGEWAVIDFEQETHPFDTVDRKVPPDLPVLPLPDQRSTAMRLFCKVWPHEEANP